MVSIFFYPTSRALWISIMDHLKRCLLSGLYPALSWNIAAVLPFSSSAKLSAMSFGLVLYLFAPGRNGKSLMLNCSFVLLLRLTRCNDAYKLHTSSQQLNTHIIYIDLTLDLVTSYTLCCPHCGLAP